MAAKWTAARRAKFARTMKAKKKTASGRGRVRARMSVRANGRTNPAAELRALGEALVMLGDALEPLSPSDAKTALEAVARQFAAS